MSSTLQSPLCGTDMQANSHLAFVEVRAVLSFGSSGNRRKEGRNLTKRAQTAADVNLVVTWYM